MDWVNWEILQNIKKPTLPTKNNKIPQNKREKRKIDLAQKVHKFFDLKKKKISNNLTMKEQKLAYYMESLNEKPTK